MRAREADAQPSENRNPAPGQGMHGDDKEPRAWGRPMGTTIVTANYCLMGDPNTRRIADQRNMSFLFIRI